MYRFKRVSLVVAGVLLLNMAVAQNDDAVNTFTPYSLYGVGDLASPGFSLDRKSVV